MGESLSGERMTLCEQLKEIVEGHFHRYPNISINSLAMKSGVGATTLRRILSLSIKGDPAPHTVLNLAAAITNEKRLSKLVTLFEGPVGELLRQTFSPYIEKNMPHCIDANLNEELKDGIRYFIYKLGADRQGVSRAEVLERFGKLGEERLVDMAARGVLIRDGEVFRAREPNFGLDVNIAAGHLPDLVKFYKAEDVSKGRNLFYTLSESMNEDGIKKIKEIQKEAVQKIYDIMNDPRYSGAFHYFSLNLCDTTDYGDHERVIQ
jgi:hypothetical protein